MKKTFLAVLLAAALGATALGATGCRARDRNATSGDTPAGQVATSSTPPEQGQLVPQPVDTQAVDAELAGIDDVLKQVEDELTNADRSPEDAD